MKRDCPSIEELGEWLELDPQDSRRAHIEQCARCRNLLASLREFRAPSHVPADANVRDAEQDLGQILTRELEGGEQKKQPLKGRRMFFRRPAIGLAFAAMALIAVVLFRHQAESPGPYVARSVSSNESRLLVLQPPTMLPDGRTVLKWNQLPGADSYRIVLYDLDLTELARFPARVDTSLILSPGDWPPATLGKPQLLWQVRAMRQGNEWIQSLPAGIKRP
ncbi:MAG: hypothetical protein KJ970_04795 [Candidatus Eisenbacteria bacterium]|uniref:Uncharacterized protein n=1 Tax=Eiseniibacteriota bacterium TaxID=2212470 RepID=A0A948RST1_UNCEI|nr:hypothetical protein [Candidatus Eisenbacteria bacterium]MBU1950387.1 hypothetical protein [Candidatus Eisenbacteria bacterium]MBU2690225.1 hypothetical protein [Candidatus Eisenbacteria bacterium]